MRGAKANEGKRIRDLIDRYFIDYYEEVIVNQVRQGIAIDIAVRDAREQCTGVVNADKLFKQQEKWTETAQQALKGCYVKGTRMCKRQFPQMKPQEN